MSERISTSSPRLGSISDDDPILAFDGAAALLRAWGGGLKPDPLAASEHRRCRSRRQECQDRVVDLYTRRVLSPG
jgi:hypothetical protein